MKLPVDTLIRRAFSAAGSFAVVSHIRPDGDAVGSLLGLGSALQQTGKPVSFVLQDDPGSRYDFLKNHHAIQRVLPQDAEFLIVVDCSDPMRTGAVLNGRRPDLVIDHHKTNGSFGLLNLIDPDAEASSLLIAQHLPEWGLKMNSDIAAALMTGIISDTIGFRTSNMRPLCLKTAADLIDAGADLPFIYQRVLLTRSFEELRYWGQGLSKLHLEDGLLWTSLTLADRSRSGYSENDDADLVNQMTTAEEMRVGVIFVEQPSNRTKVSWRSRNGLDVSILASEFGGGGHAAAAGADIEGDMQEIIVKVLSRTRKLLDETRVN